MPGKHALLECIVCQKYPIRSNNLKRHMKTHIKSNQKGPGLWIQKVNQHLKEGYGLKSKLDLGENEDVNIIKDEIGIDPGNDIDRYVWHRHESKEKSPSSLLHRDIRAIIIGNKEDSILDISTLRN